MAAILVIIRLFPFRIMCLIGTYSGDQKVSSHSAAIYPSLLLPSERGENIVWDDTPVTHSSLLRSDQWLTGFEIIQGQATNPEIG